MSKLPNGWIETSLGVVAEINPRESIKKGALAKSVPMDKLASFDKKIRGFETKEFKGGCKFRNGDTLLARITPCLENGKTAFVLDLKGEEIARGSTEFIVMRAKKNGSPYLNYCLARYSFFRDYTIQSMVGTSGRQRVPIDRVKTFELKFSRSKIKGFDTVLHPIFGKIKNNAQQIKTLTETRDALLPKLMSGGTRVKLANDLIYK
jgi:type I restriction enzyme S subunit